MSLHRFIHTLRSGEIIAIAVDASCTPPAIAVHPKRLAAKYPKEYADWRHEVVVPALVALAQEPLAAAASVEALS